MAVNGERVRKLREAQKLSRRALAEYLTISEHQLLNIEKGRVLTPDETVELALVFRDHFSVVLDDVDEEPELPVVPSLPALPAESVQAAVGPRSWTGSTQTSVPLGPVRTGPIRQVSNSEVADVLDCRRRWWLKWYRGLTPVSEVPVGPRAIGDRVHRALQQWYMPAGDPRTDPREALERLIVTDMTALAAQGVVGPEIEKQLGVEANLERAMVAGYIEWLEETGADEGLTVVAPERYVEVVLMSPEDSDVDRVVQLIGKLDVQVIREIDRARLFIDHKTVGEFVRARFKITLGDPQMMTYHLLLWLATQGEDERCDGALYNMIRRVKRTAAAKPPFFERIPVMHNRHTVENYRTRLEGTVSDMLDIEVALASGADHRRVAYPHPTNDCSWKCEFAAVCPMFDDGSRAEAMLAQLYVVKDPLSYYQGSNTEKETVS